MFKEVKNVALKILLKKNLVRDYLVRTYLWVGRVRGNNLILNLA